MAVSRRSSVAGSSLRDTQPQHLAAVVLNHRTPDDTCLAVSSLQASNRRPDRLIVVDNDVTDECRERFAPHVVPTPEPHVPSPQPRVVSYIHTGRNLGFSGGMNVGIRAALDGGADLVVLVNSDIVMSPDCLERLEAALCQQPGGGIAGPVVLSRVHPDRVASAGLRYNRRTGRMRVMGVGTRAAGASSAWHGVDAVSGCLMLVRREVFEAIGLLDERYFFGFEDLDFCLRAKDAGFSACLAHGATAHHEGGRTIGQTSSRRFYFGARNHLLVASRRVPEEGPGTRLCRLSWVAALNLAHAVTADAGSLRGRITATARGVRDYLSGRYGMDPAV